MTGVQTCALPIYDVFLAKTGRSLEGAGDNGDADAAAPVGNPEEVPA